MAWLACMVMTSLLRTACSCVLEHQGNSSNFVGRCGSSALNTTGTRMLAQQMGNLLGAESLVLDLQHNRLKDEGVSELTAGFHHLANLRSLTLLLDANELGDEAIIALAGGLEKLVCLEDLVLSLQYNNIHSVGAGMLGSAMAKIQKLQKLSLNLKFNSIGSSGTGDLAGGLSKIPKLHSLALGLFSNAIGDAGAADLGLGLAQMRHLHNLTVDLRYNHVEGGISDLRASLRQLTNVTTLLMPPELMLTVSTIDTTSNTPAMRGASPVLSTPVVSVTLSSAPSTSVTSTASDRAKVSHKPGADVMVAPAFADTTQHPLNHALASGEVSSTIDFTKGRRESSTTLVSTSATILSATHENSRRPALLDDAEIVTSTLPGQVNAAPEETAFSSATLLALFLVAVSVIVGMAYSWAKLRSSARDYRNSLPQTTAASGAAPSTQDDFNPNQSSQAPADDFDPNLPQAPKATQSEQILQAGQASQPARPLLSHSSLSSAACPSASDDFNPNEPIQPLKGPASSSSIPMSSPKDSLDSLISQSVARI
eukprot:TRINITY_DN5490_c1_g1_i1.p1 TRINITY_DN5490_c1_g1~~TRINITY_DN5490_c1_g1_i1.p1  ORF type:complete len:540 (+),score=79.37 TRINITY_DN5490_c1_g1_i1:85-1704(+)